MAQAQKGFQDPTYLARGKFDGGAIAAGAAGQSSKFVAHAAVLLMALTTYTTVLGTSTYTNTVTGVGTATASGQQVSVIIVTNTSTTTTVALSTTTLGPFLAGGQGTAAQVGGSNQFQLNTNTGTQGQGGVLVPQGSYVYVVTGTDATAATVVGIDYQVNAGAPVTI